VNGCQVDIGDTILQVMPPLARHEIVARIALDFPSTTVALAE
jgi:hypothetical protein